MQGKTIKQKKEQSPEIIMLIEKKILFFQDIIQKTILHIQKTKNLDIVLLSDVNCCINNLIEINKKLKSINNIKTNTDNAINILQIVNNELSNLFKLFGTENFDDLLWVCFGNNSLNAYTNNEIDAQKFEMLKKYFHPISYKLCQTQQKENENECSLSNSSQNLDCENISIKINQFHLKVFGLQVIVHNPTKTKSIIISGFIDDVIIECLNNKYINLKQTNLFNDFLVSKNTTHDVFNKFTQTLNLKDYLIYTHTELYEKLIGYLSNLNLISQRTINQVIKEFISADLYIKRNTLIQLLIKTDKYDNQYLTYLLYDLMSNDINGNIDTQEQIILFNSFTWPLKQYFKNAMKNTIQYTKELTNFDIQKVPLEQQICLLKATDNVKEKAMQKLKEIKAKAEDSGSKARQYLDGLLKIPFNVYKKEPILNIMNEIRLKYKNMLQINNITNNAIKDSYTSLEILTTLKEYKNNININENTNTTNYTDLIVSKLKQTELKNLITEINSIITEQKIKTKKIKINGKTKIEKINDIIGFAEKFGDVINVNANTNDTNTNDTDTNTTNVNLFTIINMLKLTTTNSKTNELLVYTKDIEEKYNKINDYMLNVKTSLDNAVYGHNHAKKQIERIIGQWINGKQDGYCFGFEGPPGIGKTSMAKKGLSDCLKDENGISRPFAMIQMGGDSNGSSLHGHNYTYVGSTWGSIVQILIDKKCMNPIIFIDEIDKISKTEHGKEIVGILTHLLDPAQNDCFQDKYFSGIDLDLSKALFVLSYNDPELIDKILLDRVHRIKFKSLTLDEKLVISKSHILIDIYEKMGLQNMITFTDEVLKFIIDEYTIEPGVRKLKEILFEIVSEINLDILKNFDTTYEIPINITIEDIKTKYFKNKTEIKYKKIHNENKIGIINGLWANSYGKGGVIPIQSNWRPSEKFLHLHLTGMQGDVMKESMNVALTLAWNLTPEQRRSQILNEQSLNGIHIHCPEGATPKDGPSAGTAITTTIFSLLNNKKIKYNIAITGEITLDGKVTEIGGLDLKFLGGIKAGVTEFIYPKENQKCYDSFMENYKDDKLTNGITFYPVETIEEVFELVFEK